MDVRKDESMKSITVSICMLFLTASWSDAQFKKGDLEISFAGGFTGIITSNLSGESGLAAKSSGSDCLAFFSCCPGYYFLDGFSVEPEFAVLAVKGSRPAQLSLVNLSYTQEISPEKFAAYGLVGYGLSNSIEIVQPTHFLERVANGFDMGVLNAGVGGKVLMTRSAILRFEYNYRMQSRRENVFAVRSDRYVTLSVLFGFSVLI